ncbi:MAG: cupin domain-containing protein [Solirubrobacterales bacterium]
MDVERRIVVSSPGSIELEDEPLDPGTVLAGDPRTAAGEIAAAALPGGSTLETGVWQCTPGVVTDVEADETFVVIAGRATIEHAGESHEVGPGDVCVLPAGAETRWTVHETLKKVYVAVDPG